jgi:hypothetical protein
MDASTNPPRAADSYCDCVVSRTILQLPAVQLANASYCSGRTVGSDGWKPGSLRFELATSWTGLSLDRGAAAIVLDIHLDDYGVMDETIDGSEPHGEIRED